MERDKFMSPEEAKDFGLIDEVVSSVRQRRRCLEHVIGPAQIPADHAS